MIRLAVFLSLLAAAVSPAWADAASEATLRELVTQIDASPDWAASVGGIRSEGAETVAEAVRLSRPDGYVAVEISSLRAENLQISADGGFSTSGVSFADVRLQVSAAMSAPTQQADDGLAATPAREVAMSVDYAVPSGTIDGLSAPSFAAFGFDPAHAVTTIAKAYSAVARVQFGAVSIPEVTSVQHQTMGGAPAAEARTSVRNIRVSGMKDGVIAQQDMGPATMAFSTPEGAFRGDIGRFYAERIDLGAFAHAFDPAAYRDGRGDGTWRPALSRAGYEGFTLNGPKRLQGRIDAISLESFDIRQADEPFTDEFDALFDPNVAPEQKSDQALNAILGLYSTMRLGTFRISGVSFEGVPDETADPIAFGLDDLSLSGISTDGLDSLILKRLRFAAPTGTGALDNFELAGFVAPDVRKLMAFAALENTTEAQKSAQTVRETFAALPRLSHIGLAGLSFGLSPAETVKVAAFSFDLRDWNEFFAQSTDVSIEGVEVPRRIMPLDPKAAEIVDAMGLDRFVLGASLTDRWTPQAGTDTATWTATLKDAGDLKLSYVLSGLTRDWVTSAIAAAGKGADSNAALQAMMAELGLKQAALSVTDRSILDRAMGFAAKKQNLTVDGATYRTQMAAALPFLLPAALPADLAKLLSAPLQGFMAGGQTLVAEINPPAPIPLPDIAQAAQGDPMTLPGKLGITLRSQPATAQ